MELPLSLQLFDADGDVSIVHRRLPHWSQAGTVCFITWRTRDSMPRGVIEAWRAERARWLQSQGIKPYDLNWRQKLQTLDLRAVRVFLNASWNRWHNDLDACHGACALRRPDLSRIVADSLQHGDGGRFLLADYVVMPNHVHVLAAFMDDQAMLAQCESWKRFTATRINRCLGQKGHFWQGDAFDHLVRTQAHFEYLRGYIADNPRRAGLREGEFVHYSRPV